MITAVLILGFLIPMILGVPVAFALGGAAFVATALSGIPLLVVFQRVFAGMDSFTLLAIPFFIFMGNIMEKGGIARRIVGLANILIGRVRGGLAAVNVLASMFFAGISGSAVADTSSIGSMLIPMMNEEGYDKPFSAAVTCSSSTIGLIIPPSNTMILYSFVAGGVSIARLFAAGIIPGILVGIGLIITGYIYALKRGYPRHPRPSMREALKIIREAFLSLIIIVIIVGGILGGIFTATEAAVFGVIYSLLLTMFVYRELKLRDLPAIVLKTAGTTTIVLFLVAASTSFSYILALERIPQVLSGFLLSITDNRIILLLLINVLLVFVGTFMDMSPAILIFTPILLPIAVTLGMSPVQFGIMLLTNLCVGLCTPPVGTVLFVGIGIAGISMAQVFKTMMVFIIPMLIVVGIVTYFEPATMFLPSLLFD
jgi:tripartite ATP-independent transporter DctM subunit